jgi:hypothetical protein
MQHHQLRFYATKANNIKNNDDYDDNDDFIGIDLSF